MKEIKTVALVGLGAIGAYFADRLQPVLGDDLRVIAGGCACGADPPRGPCHQRQAGILPRCGAG